MNDPEIAPLAQRLADENNVDWRRLQGSGANGRIVEKDVLEYLARVMAGEEALDPTPEPLPEGMEAWPEEAPGAPAPPAAAPTPGVGAPEDDDLLLAGDDIEGGGDDLLMADEPAGEPAAAAPSPPEPDLPDLFDDAEPADASAGDASPDLFDGGLSWEDDDAAGAPAGGDDALDFGGFPGGAADDAEDAAPDLGELGFDAPDAGGDAHDGGATADERGPYDELGVDGAGRDVSDFGAPDVGFRDPGGGDSEGDPGDRDLGGLESGGATPEPHPRLDDEAGPLAPDEGPLAPVADLGTHAPPERPTEPAGDATAGVDAPRADEAALPLARTRQTLRRHVDFGGALAVQRLVANGTGRGDVAVTALLLMAARQAGDALGVARPGVARPHPDGGVSAAAIEGATVGALARALADAPGGADADVDLWVADLSGYGLDDAVLDGHVLQLTLGRVLSDGDDGRVRATLALSGDVSVETGATFLSRVAELIEEPLRLLL